MKKIVSIIVITVATLIFAGCSNNEIVKHDYTYKGENELWTAEYKAIGESGFINKDDRKIYTSKSDAVVTVTYKKDIYELSSVKKLKITCKSSTGEVSQTEELGEDETLNRKTFTVKNEVKDSVVESKDEIIKVDIELDGKESMLDLKYVN